MPLAKQNIAVVGTLVRTIIGFRGDLITEMIAAGHKVYAFATDYTPENASEVAALGAIPVPYSLSRFGLNPLAELKSTWQLYNLFKQYQISLSFCYFIKPVVYGTLAAWLAGVPLKVAKIEGLGRAYTPQPSGLSFKARVVRAVQSCLLKLSLPKAQLVFFLNPDDQQDITQTLNIRLQQACLLNGIGVDLSRYPQVAPPQQPVRFVFVGRLLNEKGIRYFLAAATAIKKRYPATEFLILGEPDDGNFALSRAELMRYVNAGIVRYPGNVKNVVPYLIESNVFVLPSYYREGVPRSTQEAMAIGRAIITTDMPGCRQTVIPGENGFLVPAHNQDALENAMLQFIKKPQLIESMGQKSRELAEKHFDVSKINANIMRQLNQLPKKHNTKL